MKKLIVALACGLLWVAPSRADLFTLAMPDSLLKKPDTGSFYNTHVVVPFAAYGCEAITLFVLAKGDSMRVVTAGSMDNATYTAVDSLLISGVTSAQTLVYRITVRAFPEEADSMYCGRGRSQTALLNKPPAYIKLTVRALDEGTNLTQLKAYAWTVR